MILEKNDNILEAIEVFIEIKDQEDFLETLKLLLEKDSPH